MVAEESESARAMPVHDSGAGLIDHYVAGFDIAVRVIFVW